MPVEAADRADARARLRARRSALGPAERASADRAIRESLWKFVEEAGPKTLAGYWPIGEEPDLRELLHDWHRAGIVVALPRVVATESPLEFGAWEPDAQLARGPFGTLHPEPHAPVSPDLVILPCLGFDAQCHRLGYGGGYYDRTLGLFYGAGSVGVAYDACEMVGFEPASFDVALGAVITELRVLRRKSAG